jgi:hypothetical protein
MSFITRDNNTTPLTVKVTTKNIGALISAGNENGTDELSLVKAELWLKPLVEGFDSVSKILTPPAPISITNLLTTSSLPMKYELDVSGIPLETSTFAYIYAFINYSAFGLGAGSVWSIRSGIDLNSFDTGETSSGARVLVKIGDPKETSEEVQVTR